ncbi:MAG: SDR family oxidoreductase [Betaproteobacteria bacterium]|nr:SDR family oxidoreductase [Betaproteobacteria bacterium]
MRILIVGFGDVAARLAPLLAKRFRLYGLIRDPAKADRLRTLGVVPLIGDLDDRATLARAAALADCVIHLAPPPAHLRVDTRTRNLLAALSKTPSGREYSHGVRSRRLVYLSTTGVYGDCGGEWVTEARPLRPTNDRAKRRVDAERALRRWMRSAPAMRSQCVLRAPGIYAKDRLPLARLTAGTPALRADEDSYSNHIHADDLARATVAALFRGSNGRNYHCCDDAPLRMGHYFDLVADRFGLPRPRRISRGEAEKTLPPALLSFLRESRRLSNRRLKDELGVRLAFPTVADLLAGLSCAEVAEALSARGDTRPR